MVYDHHCVASDRGEMSMVHGGQMVCTHRVYRQRVSYLSLTVFFGRDCCSNYGQAIKALVTRDAESRQRVLYMTFILVSRATDPFVHE